MENGECNLKSNILKNGDRIHEKRITDTRKTDNC